jgi:hypothetical protein
MSYSSPNNTAHSYSLIPNSLMSFTKMVLSLSGFLTQKPTMGFQKSSNISYVAQYI